MTEYTGYTKYEKVIIKERGPFLASAVFPKEILNCVGTVTSRSGSCAFVDFKGRSMEIYE